MKNNLLNFYIGRNNISVTIFMPKDCTNNCKFCTSKPSYKSTKSNINKVLESVRLLNKTNIEEFVISGGEPFEDIELLDRIINELDENKQIFVNTTLPTHKYSEDTLAEYINNSRISCINISRHCRTFEDDTKMFSEHIASDEFIGNLRKNVKINSLINNASEIKDKLDRWYKFENTFISFRTDYRYVTRETLKQLDDDVTLAILDIDGVEYVGHGGCDVCFDITFDYNGKAFSSHRGLESSSIRFGNNVIINDIIVKQNGKIYYDWDEKVEGINNLILYLL